MACCHIPSFYFHSAGNDGHAITGDFKGGLTSLTLANQGFDFQTITDPTKECYIYENNTDHDEIDFNEITFEETGENAVDCKGKWMNIYGSYWKSSTITGIITTR